MDNHQDVPAATLTALDGSARQILQDNMVSLLKNLPTWDKLAELEQRKVFTQLDNVTKVVIEHILSELATDGRKCIRVSIGEVKIGKTIKLAVAADKTDENVQDISLLPETQAYLIPTNEIGHLERRFPTADPDQPELTVGEGEGIEDPDAEENEGDEADAAAGDEAEASDDPAEGAVEGETAEFDPAKADKF